jgi:xylose isomerase
VNIKANHATLAGHSFHQEITTAISLGLFGSIDAKRGEAQNSWDSD